MRCDAELATQVYLARVKGRFPADLAHLRELPAIDFGTFGEDTEVSEEGSAPLIDGSTKKRHADSTCTESCQTAEGAPGQKTKPNFKQQKAAKAQKPQKHSTPHSSGGGAAEPEELPERVRPVLSLREVGAAANVGFRYENTGGESGSLLWVQCPIGVVSHRDGVHACDPDGKASLSSFRLLGYCADSDTSLVECGPYTGRTHQLRLHLQLVGNPIANDPCYGGQLFYGDRQRRVRALEALRLMRSSGCHPLSKVPHLEEDSEDELLLQATSTSAATAELASPLECEKLAEEAQGSSETDDEYLVRTCR